MSSTFFSSSQTPGYSSIINEDSDNRVSRDSADTSNLTTQRSSQRSSNTLSLSHAIIDGEVSSVGSRNEFENLAGLSFVEDPSVTIALDFCKKYILFSYNILLIVIGWRRLRSKYDHFPFYKKFYNAVYPIFILFMLTSACICQIATCFSRSRSHPPLLIENFINHTLLLECDDHLFTSDIISYLMILSSFLIGIYIFRWAEPENISSLAETVFLSYNRTSMRMSRRRPAIVLLGFIILGMCWVVFSFGVSLLRLFSLGLDSPDTVIFWFVKNRTNIDLENVTLRIGEDQYEVIHYVLTTLAFIGFPFFDLLYTAIVLNYCFQCQLLTYYIRNIIDKVQSRTYKNLMETQKDVYRIYEFMKQMNGWLSYITTLALFVFIGNLIASYLDLTHNTRKEDHINIAVGFCNVIQWLLAASFPIIMAVRFTLAGRGLKRLGLEVAQRPYNYSTQSDIELQYFLNYMSATKYSARLACVPMVPALVIGGTFVLLLLLTSGIVIPQINSVNWF